ncbi:MAG: hypothetical protein HRT72_04595, partial [Flavobacteriales bacterium]|nr:hypothetical protein [Flavobacteriales bacterium]
MTHIRSKQKIRNLKRVLIALSLYQLSLPASADLYQFPERYQFPPGIDEGEYWARHPADAVNTSFGENILYELNDNVRGGWFTNKLTKPILVAQTPQGLCEHIIDQLNILNPRDYVTGFIEFVLADNGAQEIQGLEYVLTDLLACTIEPSWDSIPPENYIQKPITYYGFKYSYQARKDYCRDHSGRIAMDKHIDSCDFSTEASMIGCLFESAAIQKSVEKRCMSDVPDSVEICRVGNPIDVVDGNKVQNEVDFVGVGSFPLKFERFYSSNRGGWTYSYTRTFDYSNDVENESVSIKTG